MYNNRYFCLLFGLAAGVTAGLLSTPRAGARNRAMISKKAKHAAAEVRDSVTETFDRGKNFVKRTVSAVEAGRKTFTA